jgi:hypothetical protein
MKRIKINDLSNSEIINSLTVLLEYYNSKLSEDPDSLFYKGIIKKTEEYIKSLS